MKIYFAVILFLLSTSVLAQNFEPVYIVNNEIVSQAVIEQYAKNGLIKGMNNGVTEEVFAELKRKFGDKLVAKEFVALIEIFTPEELKAKKASQADSTDSTPKNVDNEYVLREGDQAQNFEVLMLNGNTLQLSDLKGKVILLNFWATWCAPCIREFYEIPSKILNEFEGEEFVFLPIAIEEDRQRVMSKLNELRKKGISFPSGLDEDGSIFKMYASGNIPKNFIINSEGKIVYTSTGNSGNSVDEIQRQLKKLFNR